MTILNVASGEDLHPDAINVDIRPVADVQADMSDLPYPDNSISELRAFDCLEHVPNTMTQAVLAEWWRVLAPGGVLLLRAPNLHAIAAHLTYWADKPGPQLHNFIENLYGGGKFGPDGIYDRHFWGFTPASLHVALSDAGFEVRDNNLAINMTVEAAKI